MVNDIIPLLPKCKVYVEPFGGGASILLARRPVAVEVYNDLDPGLYNFFKVMANGLLFNRFYRRVMAMPCHRAFYDEYLETWKDQEDRVERAAQWYILARQSFGGRFGAGYGTAVTTSVRGMASTTSNWITALKALPFVHERLRRAHVTGVDYRKVLDRWDGPETLFYCDPPYVHDERSDVRYDNELTNDEHIEFIDRIMALEGMVVLSGYPNDIYKTLEFSGWETIDFETTCSVAGRVRGSGLQGEGAVLENQPRTERVWRNPQSLEKVDRQLALI